MRFVAWYSIMVGLLMLAQRLFFLLAGQVPEFKLNLIVLLFIW